MYQRSKKSPLVKQLNLLLLIMSMLIASCQTSNVQQQKLEKLKNQTENNFSQREYSKAVEGFSKLLKIDSANSGEYYFKRAVAKSYLKDFESSNSDFTLAIKRGYNLKIAYIFLSDNAFYQKADTVLALQYINMAYKIDPKDETIIIKKLVLMGKDRAMKFTMDSLLN